MTPMLSNNGHPIPYSGQPLTEHQFHTARLTTRVKDTAVLPYQAGDDYVQGGLYRRR